MNSSGFFKKLTRDLPKLIERMLIGVVVVSLLLFALTAFGTLHGSKKEPKEENKQSESAQSSDAPSEEARTEASTTAETPTTAEEPETQTESETAPETEAPYETEPRELVEIRSLGTGEINEIAEKYDREIHRYIIGYEDVAVDENNRPVYGNDLLATFSGLDAKVKVYCADENTPRAALSFMAGNDASCTEEVLNILKDSGVQAVFFVTHTFAADHPDLVNRMISEGHEIGNYSYTDPQEGVANLEPLDQVFEAFNMQRYMDLAFDYNMQRYCFNRSSWSQLAVMLTAEMGYEVCFSSVNFQDDDPGLQLDDAAVLAGLEKNLHNGAVYGFHLNNGLIVRILPDLISFIREQGFQLIPM